VQKNIEKLIPFAIEAAEKYLTGEGEPGVIAAEYNGYIASFGASVIQAGLKPALAFNLRESSGSHKDRRTLMRALFHIIQQKNKSSIKYKNLLEYVLEEPAAEKQRKKEIIDATTALKLAIRTFTLKREEV
jgi:CRISPR-associated protein Cmr5